MEEVVLKEDKTLKKTFIAGGFFLKYKRDKFQTEEDYRKYFSNQVINIYVYIGKNIFKSTKK